MAELLVKAVDQLHLDLTKDRRGTHKKGDIVIVAPDGHVWGAREGLPRFVVVRCPEVTVDQVRDRTQMWKPDIQFEVLNSNLSIDGHRIRMTNANAGASGLANITQAQVQTFLTNWGASFVSATADSVTFDIAIGAAAMTPAFWDAPLAGIELAEIAYVQGTGVHTLTATYDTHLRWLTTPLSFEAEVRHRIATAGGTFVSEGEGVTTFTIERSAVRERFRAHVTERLGTFRRHRYHFTEAQVDTVIGLGGSITVTAAQLIGAVQDRLAE